MKIKKTSRNKKKSPLLIGGIVGAVMLLGGVAYGAYYWYAQDNQASQTSEPTSEIIEDQATDMSNEGTLPSKSTTDQSTSTSTDDETQPNDPSLESPVLSRATASNGRVKVVATFQDTTSGTCRFAFSSSQATLYYTSPIVVGPSYYYCSLDLPTSDFGQSSTWEVTAYNTTDNGSKASNTVELVVS